MSVLLSTAAVAPARGTPLSDLVPASICGLIGVLLVLAIAVGHRRGAFGTLARISERAEAVTGEPGFAVIPRAMASASLLVAAFGYYWDVSWHIDRGRDPGPFANPAHWLIIIGLAGIALAGVCAIVLGDERSTRSSLRIRDDWNVPIGGILLTLCGVVALAGFPLDDVWHRLFGQDVTAWGPTHIQMIAGASLSTLAMWVLNAEGARVAHANGRVHGATWQRINDIAMGGAFLIGLSTLQVEFDFGVPQFRQVNHAVLLMLAAGIGLVAVRVRGGRGAALGAATMFVVFRAGLALAIAGLGRSVLHFPLYLVEAGIVEVIALAITTDRPLRFGAIAGTAIGTVGLATEWAWTHVFMPMPWHASLFPEAAIAGFVAAVAAGVIGGAIGRSLVADRLLATGVAPAADHPRRVVVLAGLAAVACLAWSLPIGVSHASAALTIDDVQRDGERWGIVTATLTPADAADNARYFGVLSWQGRPHGDGGLVLADMHRVAPGVYRASKPVPLAGSWKTMVRLHTGRTMSVVPIYMPLDRAIPAPAITTGAHATRTFVRDKQVLQREAVGGSVGLQRGAYALLAAIAALWIAAIAWGLGRLEHEAEAPPGGRRVRRVPTGQPAMGRA
jgi:hypothetical protein